MVLCSFVVGAGAGVMEHTGPAEGLGGDKWLAVKGIEGSFSLKTTVVCAGDDSTMPGAPGSTGPSHSALVSVE